MKRKVHKIEEYRDISSDVWAVFKKYFPDGSSTDTFAAEVGVLEEKYKMDVRQYCFMRKLLKVYFDELNELKGLRNG